MKIQPNNQFSHYNHYIADTHKLACTLFPLFHPSSVVNPPYSFHSPFIPSRTPTPSLLQRIPQNAFKYKIQTKFLFMDLELTQESQPWTSVFNPIEELCASTLSQQPIQLENPFSLSPHLPNPDLLLTLLPNTLLISTSSSLRQLLAFTHLSFDLKFEVLYETDKNVRSPKIGLRLFLDDQRTFSLYSSPSVVEGWALCLSKHLNQLGFHEMFKPLKKLGKGNFASVYEVERLTDGRRYAVKAFSKQNCFSAKNGKQSLINELSIMRSLSGESHANLLRLECVFESSNSIYVVLELLGGGQLFHRIQERNGHFKEEEVREVMGGLLRGLRAMHGQRIMHRDLKPENIMLRAGKSLEPVIVDYGLATCADLEKYLFFRCGTPGYVAPEIIALTESKPIEPLCDVFSAGVIFHILLTRRPLFEGAKYDQVYKKNKEMKFSFEGEAYSRLPPDALALLTRMLLPDPTQRISAAEALQHPYFCGAGEELKMGSPVPTAASPRVRAGLLWVGSGK